MRTESVSQAATTENSCFPSSDELASTCAEKVEIELATKTVSTEVGRAAATSTTQNAHEHHYLHKGACLEDVEAQLEAIKVIDSDGTADFPDGGFRAWMVVLGCYLAGVATFGFVNSWGVFQSYYEQVLMPTTNPSSIAWIGSIQYSLVFLPGLLTGRLFDLGYFHLPFALSSTALVLFVFLTAECTQYWQFLLCQGLAVGTGCGMVFSPSMAILGHWFYHKRGLALGITALGSSTGGTLFPILTRKLIPMIGFPWAVRVLGFCILVSLLVANLTLKRRLPPKNVSSGLLTLQDLKNPVFTLYCIAQFFSYLGLYTVLTYIDVSATFVGVSPDFSFYLVSIVNAGSALGRISGGLVVDHVGCINIVAPVNALAGALTFAWPYATSLNALIGIAIPYGFASGISVSTFLLPIFHMGRVEDLGRMTGIGFLFLAVGAVAGPPISGAIIHATGGYNAAGYYAGSMCIFSVILLLLTRHLMLRKLWGKF